MRSSATSRTWSSILCIGMMRAACTIAASSPASRHSCRNTLLSTWRIAGFSPKLTFERPRIVDDAGQLGLDAPDRLDRLHAVAAQVLLARAEREREQSKIRSVGSMPYRSIASVVDALADAELPVGVARLALLVDREADHRGAVLACERHHAVEARALGLAVLEVGGVEDRLAARVLQPGLDDRRLGGVEHQRERGLGREAARDLLHVDVPSRPT